MTPTTLQTVFRNEQAGTATNPATETATPETGTPVSDSTRTSAEFETFLNLLTAQIRNQDPLAPLDSTQFVEQLATFSGLELQAKGNQVLEDIAAMLTLSLAENTTGPAPILGDS